jgi:uncharacterized OB-fold protein
MGGEPVSTATLEGAAAPFADGLAAGRVRYQVCRACQRAQTLTRFACSACDSEQLDWRDASGRGIVHAVSVVARAPSEVFRPLIPYTLVLVTLVEGPRVMGHGRPGLAIGDKVSATFFDHGGRPLLRFIPTEEECCGSRPAT